MPTKVGGNVGPSLGPVVDFERLQEDWRRRQVRDGKQLVAVLNELDAVSRSMWLRWCELEASAFVSVGKKDDAHRLRYAAHRDMSAVIRFCYPLAARLACAVDPSYAETGSPLHRVVEAYTLGLTEAENRGEGLLAIRRRLFCSPENIRAFLLFGGILTLVETVYLLIMPRLADEFPDTWPDIAPTTLKAITRAAFARDDASRKTQLEELARGGVIPEDLCYEIANAVGDGFVESMLALFIEEDVPVELPERLKQAERELAEMDEQEAQSREFDGVDEESEQKEEVADE